MKIGPFQSVLCDTVSVHTDYECACANSSNHMQANKNIS